MCMGRPFILAWGLLKSFRVGDIQKNLYRDLREGPPLHELGQMRPEHQEGAMDKRRELERGSPETMDEAAPPLTDEERQKLIERVLTLPPRPSSPSRQSTLEEFA